MSDIDSSPTPLVIKEEPIDRTDESNQPRSTNYSSDSTESASSTDDRSIFPAASIQKSVIVSAPPSSSSSNNFSTIHPNSSTIIPKSSTGVIQSIGSSSLSSNFVVFQFNPAAVDVNSRIFVDEQHQLRSSSMNIFPPPPPLKRIVDLSGGQGGESITVGDVNGDSMCGNFNGTNGMMKIVNGNGHVTGLGVGTTEINVPIGGSVEKTKRGRNGKTVAHLHQRDKTLNPIANPSADQPPPPPAVLDASPSLSGSTAAKTTTVKRRRKRNRPTQYRKLSQEELESVQKFRRLYRDGGAQSSSADEAAIDDSALETQSTPNNAAAQHVSIPISIDPYQSPSSYVGLVSSSLSSPPILPTTHPSPFASLLSGFGADDSRRSSDTTSPNSMNNIDSSPPSSTTGTPTTNSLLTAPPVLNPLMQRFQQQQQKALESLSEKELEEHRLRRQRNNEAVRKSRMKARLRVKQSEMNCRVLVTQFDEMKTRIEQLEKELRWEKRKNEILEEMLRRSNQQQGGGGSVGNGVDRLEAATAMAQLATEGANVD